MDKGVIDFCFLSTLWFKTTQGSLLSMSFVCNFDASKK